MPEETTFWDDLAEREKRTFALNKFALTQTLTQEEDQKEFPMEHAVRHATVLRLLQEKLECGSTLYLGCYRDVINSSVMLMINTSPLNKSKDAICIWRAISPETNSDKCAYSVMKTVACLLTLFGFEVYTSEQGKKELFNPIFAGKGTFDKKEKEGSNA